MSWSANRTHALLSLANQSWIEKPIFSALPRFFSRRRSTSDHVNDFADQQTIFLILIVHIIIITGIPGNILTLLVLQKKSMNDNFVSIFLSTMCLVDLWCLATGFYAYWWMAVSDGNDIRLHSEVYCLYHWSVTLIGLEINAWLIVLISACRIYVVVYRSKKHKRDSNLGALCMMVGLVTVISVPGYFMVKDSLVITYKDGAMAECEFTMGGSLRLIYYILTTMLPSVLVIAENAVMHHFYRSSMPPNMRQRPANIAANQRMKMLIVMTDIMFFTTSVPPLIFHEVSRNIFPPEDLPSAVSRKFELVLMFCVLYGGFAYNIVIYCCFGRRFRAELKTLLLTPFHMLGYCKKVHVRDTGSIRNVDPIPFSVFTQSSAGNQSDVIKAISSISVVAKISQDLQMDNHNRGVKATLSGEEANVDSVAFTTGLRNYGEVDIDFPTTSSNLDKR